MATGLSLILRDIQPHDRVFEAKSPSWRAIMRSKNRPTNACKVPMAARVARRRMRNGMAATSKRANR